MKSIFISSLIIFSTILYTGCDTRELYGYEDWDTNQDENIDRNEFAIRYQEESYYEDWDLNSDGVIDQAEWETGMDDSYNDYDHNLELFSEWDQDQDQTLNEDEFIEGSYQRWDKNKDESIDTTEYELYYMEE